MKDKIRQLVEEELARANEKFPPFHSAHEGWAVLKEEIEETDEDFRVVRNYFYAMWDFVRHNDHEGLQDCLYDVRKYALSLIAEVIQVAAMARKFEQFLEGQKDGR